MSAHLALGAAALLVGAAALSGRGAGSSNEVPSVAALRQALRQSGSPNRRVGSGNGDALTENKAYKLFLKMESADVPDELLVGVLIAGGKGDPVAKARELLASVQGSVGQIVEGSSLLDVDLTDAQRAKIRAGAELARRAQVRQFLTNDSPVKVQSPEDMVHLLQRISTGPREVMSALYFDRQMNLVGVRKISEGDSGSTIANPVEVIRPAIVLRAIRIAMAHQHPSGDARPSQADISTTTRMQAACQAVGIQLIDHLIIGGDGRWTSLATEGYLR
jgi:DNA repair protein RadC